MYINETDVEVLVIPVDIPLIAMTAVHDAPSTVRAGSPALGGTAMLFSMIQAHAHWHSVPFSVPAFPRLLITQPPLPLHPFFLQNLTAGRKSQAGGRSSVTRTSATTGTATTPGSGARSSVRAGSPATGNRSSVNQGSGGRGSVSMALMFSETMTLLALGADKCACSAHTHTYQ